MAHRMIRCGSLCFRSNPADSLQQHAIGEEMSVLHPPTHHRHGRPRWGNPLLSSHLHKDLDSRSHEVSNISEQFDTIRKEWGIKCIFFKEARKDVEYLNGAHHDAGLAEPSVKLDTDYGGAAKLPDQESSLGLVLNEMRKALIKEPKQPFKSRPQNAERVYAKLKRYDTRFLVDDSDSMDGPRWTTTKKIMVQIAEIAVRYDRNGVDVRFFNEDIDDEKRLNLDSAKKVMSLFDNLEPEGSNPYRRYLGSRAE